MHAAGNNDWPIISPTDAGFAPDLAARLDARVDDGRFANLHGALVVRGGRLVVERYYTGLDERWGDRLGPVTFGPDVVHDMRSISKSIVGLTYGIALAEGLLPDVGQPVIDHFPAYPDLVRDAKRRNITIGHTLTMTMGLAWDEDLSYRDPRNNETGMEMVPDRYRYVLEQPIVKPPGQHWNYSGGATALLAHLIGKGTGGTLFDYVREKLFDPLGIADAEWITGRDGEPAAASGLRLRPRDLARIGQLIMDRGRRDGVQVVPESWLDQSFTPRADTRGGLDYGYQWWLGRHLVSGKPWMGAFGNGGQRLTIMPSLDLIVVVTAGNYNQPDAWQLPVSVLTEVVLPALEN